jgi:hypothetical protein
MKNVVDQIKILRHLLDLSNLSVRYREGDKEQVVPYGSAVGIIQALEDEGTPPKHLFRLDRAARRAMETRFALMQPQLDILLRSIDLAMQKGGVDQVSVQREFDKEQAKPVQPQGVLGGIMDRLVAAARKAKTDETEQELGERRLEVPKPMQGPEEQEEPEQPEELGGLEEEGLPEPPLYPKKGLVHDDPPKDQVMIMAKNKCRKCGKKKAVVDKLYTGKDGKALMNGHCEACGQKYWGIKANQKTVKAWEETHG